MMQDPGWQYLRLTREEMAKVLLLKAKKVLYFIKNS